MWCCFGEVDDMLCGVVLVRYCASLADSPVKKSK